MAGRELMEAFAKCREGLAHGLSEYVSLVEKIAAQDQGFPLHELRRAHRINKLIVELRQELEV